MNINNDFFFTHNFSNQNVNIHISLELIDDIGKLNVEGNNVNEIANNLISYLENNHEHYINITQLPNTKTKFYDTDYIEKNMMDPIYYCLNYKELDANSFIIISNQDNDYNVDFFKKSEDRNEGSLFKSNGTTITPLRDEELLDLEDYQDSKLSVIFTRVGASKQKISFQESDVIIEKDGIECFHKELLGQVTAPFQHERQKSASDGKCGYYAFNAFMGNHTPLETFTGMIKDILYSQSDGEPTEIDILKNIHPIKLDREEDLDTNNYIGLDPLIIANIIKRIMLLNELPTSNYIKKNVIIEGVDINNNSDIQTNGWGKIESEIIVNLLNNQCDRFMCGITSPFENHFIAYRKDKDNNWWKIDSIVKNQVSFENLQSIISDLKSDYGNSNDSQLYFIYLEDKNKLNINKEISLLDKFV